MHTDFSKSIISHFSACGLAVAMTCVCSTETYEELNECMEVKPSQNTVHQHCKPTYVKIYVPLNTAPRKHFNLHRLDISV